MFRQEGYSISSKMFEDDAKRRIVCDNGDNIPDIRLVGSRDKEEDAAFFAKILRHCNKTTKKILFYNMTIGDIGELTVFPLLTSISFECCNIGDGKIFRFNEWCPNITELKFLRYVTFDSDEEYDALISTDVIYPKMKTLALNVNYNMEFDINFVIAMDQKFPSLQSFDLTLELKCFDEDDPTYNVPYQPLYFKNLKKLSIFNYGEDISKMLDYLSISNKKLKEFTLYGMMPEQNIFSWIGSCTRLDKLTFHCAYLDESNMNTLPEMRYLKTVIMDVKQFHWENDEMIEFIRKQKYLRFLKIESDRKNKQMKYGDDFKKIFTELLENRPLLRLKIIFFQDDREIDMSKKGFKEKQDEVESSEDEF